MAESSTSSVYEEDSPTPSSIPISGTHWPDLVKFSQYIRKSGWEHRPVPEELTQLPDDIAVPQILRDIINWSLVPGTNWSHQPLDKCSRLSSCSAGPSTSQILQRNSQSSVISKSDAQTPASSIDNVSASSYTTSLTRRHSQEYREPSSEDKSLTVKFLTTIGLTKSKESPIRSETKSECISCFDEFVETEMVLLPSCRHWYCKECLNTLVVTAMATEASFPPKCCLSPIPLQQILKTLSAKQRETYQEKAAEYAVPTTERWYCPNRTCLKWIPASSLKINRQAGYDCPHCAAKLCRTCRGDAHPNNTECPQDFGLEATLETAEIEGWQRCYSCRALVEHNTGCRHMTCRCRAQFCYVCGLRWQTCSCTEADAANKRNAAQTRRQERTVQRDAEAAEIARAIAEVEAMERREAEERRLEEEQQQREEEEQLRALEALRLLEEAKRIEDEARAEREFRAALITSFREEWSLVEQTYHRILAFQMEKINCRHKSEDERLTKLYQDGTADAKQKFDAFSQMLVQNCDWRQRRLTTTHTKEQDILTARQEEEEDSTFIQAQIRLRGKANKESRLEKMMEEVHKQHEEERSEMSKKHEEESNLLEKKIEVDRDGLQRWYETKVHEVGDQQKVSLQKIGHTIGADRQYCEMVSERRRHMLAKHEAVSLASIEAGADPTGLTEFEASKVEPFLPVPDEDEAGPSDVPRNQESEPSRFYAQVTSFISPDEPNRATSAQMAGISRRNLIPPQTPRPPSVFNTRDYLPLVPGSFPVDASPILPIARPTQPFVPAVPTSPPPPPPPLIPKALLINKPTVDNHKPNTSPPVPVRFTPQRQHTSSTNLNIFKPLMVSSLGSDIGSWGTGKSQHEIQALPRPPQALGLPPPTQPTPIPQQELRVSTVSSTPVVTVLDSPVSPMSPASMAPPPPPPRSSERLTLQRAAARAEKKSNNVGSGNKWAFMSRHHNISEEEMKYRLQQTMGDASMSSPFRYRVK